MENTTKSREKKQKDKYDHSIADIFIENATVITLDEQRRVIRDGGVVIEGNRIKDIGKSSELQKRYKAARIINGKDRVILPGFIDSHVHANQSFVKSLIHGEPYLYWSRIFRPFEYVMTEEDSYIATLLHILTSIRMGITCFVETGSYYPDVMGQAVVETGMRCVLSRLTMDTKGDLPHTQQGILPDETTEEGLQRSSEFVERWHGQGDGRIRAWLSMHMLQICSDDLYCGAKKLADKYGVGVQTHLGSVRAETDYSLLRWGRRPIEHLDDLGVLGPKFLIHHGVLCSDSDIRKLAEREVGVVHCPNAAVMSKQGIARIPQMIDAGVTVALGGDGYFVDHLELMKFAEAMLIPHWGERYNDPNVLLPETLLEMGTLNGAKAVSWDDEIGSLKAGKRADLIIMRLGQAHQTPHWDLLAEVVHHSYASDIETVIVDGKILMEDRKVLVLDEEEILRKSQTHATRVFREGVELGLIRKFQKLERWPFV